MRENTKGKGGGALDRPPWSLAGSAGDGDRHLLLPLRGCPAARAEGNPLSPAWAVVGRRRLRVREVLSRFLVEGEWWRGEEREAIALRLLLEDGSVVTALSPLEERDG
ncbi:hypothetical protein HRbin41_00987 [bacterium HR41]|nr:hypothetical protein HRbin41_00987 [bacterium HR41]